MGRAWEAKETANAKAACLKAYWKHDECRARSHFVQPPSCPVQYSSAGSLITPSKHFHYLWISFILLGKSGPLCFKSTLAIRGLQEPPDPLVPLGTIAGPVHGPQ